jgi:hypothetical protein
MTLQTTGVLVSLLQVIIALGLINVWLVRFKKSTKYRGGTAQNMQQEFAAYGLPAWSVYVIGGLKVIIAAVLLLNVFLSDGIALAASRALTLLTVLMLGAISMHLRVKDSFIKFVPALLMFGMAILSLYLMNLS